MSVFFDKIPIRSNISNLLNLFYGILFILILIIYYYLYNINLNKHVLRASGLRILVYFAL